MPAAPEEPVVASAVCTTEPLSLISNTMDRPATPAPPVRASNADNRAGSPVIPLVSPV